MEITCRIPRHGMWYINIKQIFFVFGISESIHRCIDLYAYAVYIQNTDVQNKDHKKSIFQIRRKKYRKELLYGEGTEKKIIQRTRKKNTHKNVHYVQVR